MRLFIVMALVLVALLPSNAFAQAATYCDPGVTPTWDEAFQPLRVALGPLIGIPRECVHMETIGEVRAMVQRSTTGIAAGSMEYGLGFAGGRNGGYAVSLNTDGSLIYTIDGTSTWSNGVLDETGQWVPPSSVLMTLAAPPVTSSSTSYAPPPSPSGTIVDSRIDGDFTGWEGETVFRLQNGQIWQQSSYSYQYHYAFNPRVLIYSVSGGYRMQVEGVSQTIMVQRLR